MNIPQEFEHVFQGVELTEDEIRTLNWIAGWESQTVENLRSAIRKAQETALSTLQDESEKLRAELEYEKEHANAYYEECGQWEAENTQLRVELEQVKRCIEIVENQRDAAIYDMTALMAGQCCDLCAVEYCRDRSKTVMCTAFKWRGPQKED